MLPSHAIGVIKNTITSPLKLPSWAAAVTGILFFLLTNSYITLSCR